MDKNRASVQDKRKPFKCETYIYSRFRQKTLNNIFDFKRVTSADMLKLFLNKESDRNFN